jgi:hypothetical protein
MSDEPTVTHLEQTSMTICIKKLVVTAVVTFAVSSGPTIGAAQANQERGARPGKDVCKDEKGVESSKGALRKVNEQVQVCNANNRWSIAPGMGSAPQQASTPPKKPCTGKHGETYDDGLFRSNGKTFDRCSNGTWAVK